MTDYSRYSFWLETAGENLLPRPSLTASLDVDVAILGAGYSGLWTAYYLLRENPGLRVAVVEKEIVGFGASGRNGGWCSPRFPVTPAMLKRRYGRDAARSLMLAMHDAVEEIGRVCAEENIDAHFHRGGNLTLARGIHHLPLLRATRDGYERLGLGDRYRWLSPEETSERVKVTKVLGALYSSEGASVHPGRLVRGLARAVERHGGVIYERTAVTDFETGGTPRLLTPAGELRANKAIILAGEAYLTRLRKLHRSLLPMYSLITLTAPLTKEQWTQIGWQNGESISSCRYTVDYLTKTSDGRILFGSRGAPYAFGSKISDEMDRHARTHADIQRAVVDWFPALQGVEFTHAWGGPVGMPRDWMPTVCFDSSTRIGTAHGYTGQGVATTNLAARLLAGLVAQKSTGLESLPLHRTWSPNWELEPLRWLAVRYLQSAFLRIDSALEAGEARPKDSFLAELLGKH